MSVKFHRHHHPGGRHQTKVSRKDIGLMKPLSLIVAVDEQGGFGKDGKIPWNEPEDMKRFRKLTKGAACIMGRQTYDDMYAMVVERKTKGKRREKKKPVVIDEILPGRQSYVVTRSKREMLGATTVPGVRFAVEQIPHDNIFILGGELIFKQALPFVNTAYVTMVDGVHDCDRFFPMDYLCEYFRIMEGEECGNLRFLTYRRIK